MKFISIVFPLLLLACSSTQANSKRDTMVSEPIETQKPEIKEKPEGQMVKGTGYSITYPLHWELRPSFKGTDTMAKSPPTSEGDNFHENIKVNFEATPINNAETYLKSAIPSMKANLKNFTILSESPSTVSGLDAVELTYTHEFQDTIAKNRAIFFLSDGIGFVITTTASPETYDEYYKIFNQIIASFIIQ